MILKCIQQKCSQTLKELLRIKQHLPVLQNLETLARFNYICIYIYIYIKIRNYQISMHQL